MSKTAQHGGQDDEMSISDLLRSMTAQVPREKLFWASKALEFFGDKPTQPGLNEVILAQKLALYFHRGQFTSGQIIRAMQALDETETFRPTMAEWKRELERIADHDHRASFKIAPPALELPASANPVSDENREARLAALRAKFGAALPPYEREGA